MRALGCGAGLSTPRTHVGFERVDTLNTAFSPSVGIGAHKLAASGNRLAVAWGTGGVGLYDTTDLANIAALDLQPSTSASWKSIRAVEFNGDVLFSCGRGSAGPTAGAFEAWGTSADTLAILDIIDSTALFSDLSFNSGTNIVCLSGQRIGAYTADVSNPASLSIIDSDETVTPYWETQGNTQMPDGSAVVFCNYATDNVAFHTASLTAGVFGAFVDTPSTTISGYKIRPWRNAIVDDVMYVCNNSNNIIGYSILTVWDVSDITQPFPLLATVVIPDAFKGPWIGTGDTPSLAVCVTDDYVFIANARFGVAVFYKDTAGDLFYIGNIVDTVAEEDIEAFTIIERDGDIYVISASSTHTTQCKGNIYVDKLVIT